MDINYLLSTIFINPVYSYFLLFLIMVFEGPIITFVAAFLSFTGFFNIYIVFIISILGSFIPDIICFWIGRNWKIEVKKKVRSSNHEILKTINKILIHIEDKPLRSIAIIKIVPPLPVWGLILTGTTKIKFIDYLKYILIVGIPFAFFFTFSGFFFGSGFNIIINYLNLGENILFYLVPILTTFIILYLSYYKKIIKKSINGKK